MRNSEALDLFFSLKNKIDGVFIEWVDPKIKDIYLHKEYFP